ncbi:hypothetical protein LEP1GSC203_3476 [Leptospira terpstrae serovar Hualin str. LT 11-33 = ATCC 700639]|uniref:Uncharacterized protein n=2 Tax=Leptospira TaxID=171 RepID=N1VVZ7_9LEPT|nr:hypothetical protein LEP1GSC203_3476 [Leptospira terpstrae serovar Hualin str. LT 11-33 = ATCC 700639]
MNQNLRMKSINWISLVVIVFTSFIELNAEPKDPPSSITFVEGGVTKTFYRNPNVVAEFVNEQQAQTNQKVNQGKLGIKFGWNVRPAGKELFPKSTKSTTNSKVTEVYSTSVGAGANLVLPGILIVSFSIDQSAVSLDRISKKYGIKVQNQFSPRLVSFQTEPGFISVEKANEVLSEPNVLEAYPDTAVEKSLK